MWKAHSLALSFKKIFFWSHRLTLIPLNSSSPVGWRLWLKQIPSTLHSLSCPTEEVRRKRLYKTNGLIAVKSSPCYNFIESDFFADLPNLGIVHYKYGDVFSVGRKHMVEMVIPGNLILHRIVFTLNLCRQGCADWAKGNNVYVQICITWKVLILPYSLPP